MMLDVCNPEQPTNCYILANVLTNTFVILTILFLQ